MHYVMHYVMYYVMRFEIRHVMRHVMHHVHVMQGMLELLVSLNERKPPPSRRFSMQTGGFLVLYSLFTDATKCRPGVVGGWLAPSCSASFATLLLSFLDLSEPTLLHSAVLCLARCPVLGPLLPELVDTRVTKRRDVFSGVPTPEEPQTPLATLLRSLLAELQVCARRVGCMRGLHSLHAHGMHTAWVTACALLVHPACG